MSESGNGKLGYWEVTAIGVGGMVGGGIFAVLGLSVDLTRGGAPIAFLMAGMVALVTSYSYARLSVTFPSQGGTVAFLDRAFGPGLLTGSANILLWMSYIVMLSLYAYAFGSYGASLFPPASQLLWKHVLITGSVLAITGLNLLNAKLIGEAEDWIVLIKLTILVLFIAVGIWGVDGTRLAPSAWSSPVNLIAGGMIIFLAYEGFELIANTAQDVRDHEGQELSIPTLTSNLNKLTGMKTLHKSTLMNFCLFCCSCVSLTYKMLHIMFVFALKSTEK